MDHSQALADALVAQRNEAHNALAVKIADLAVAQDRIKELEAEVAALKAQKPQPE